MTVLLRYVVRKGHEKVRNDLIGACHHVPRNRDQARRRQDQSRDHLAIYMPIRVGMWAGKDQPPNTVSQVLDLHQFRAKYVENGNRLGNVARVASHKTILRRRFSAAPTLTPEIYKSSTIHSSRLRERAAAHLSKIVVDLFRAVLPARARADWLPPVAFPRTLIFASP